QTHIVAELAQKVADGELKSQFINVESEHSAASVCLGASATGVRTFTSSSSQGLMLMYEVLFNIAGLRLPVVLICANRAVSAPLNIWNDQQDSISVRDAGIMQFYAENGQEAADLIFLAYRVAEDHRVLLPAMVCLDGYLVSHAWEAADIPEPEEVAAYLPPYQPLYKLDPASPVSFGMYCEPDKYTETRFMIQKAMENAVAVTQEAAHDFERRFGRMCCGLMEEYKTDGATTIFVALGSVTATIRQVVDELRAEGKKVGLLRLISYRPFPREQLYEALKGAQNIIVLEKAISLGSYGCLLTELRSLFYCRPSAPTINGFIAGLGGRDITPQTLKTAFA
ncbi:MAG: pyruvate ferredoxin oxidoreductase, partial [Chloroflexota bacterium]